VVHRPGAPVTRLAALRRLATRPLPEPPAGLRRGPFREGSFRSRLHDAALAARLGRWLGVLFAVCLVTGLLSHWAQSPDPWVAFPTRPVWLYRVTQGVHVLAGMAMIPVLLVKLFVVYPRLFTWPPVRSFLHGLERLSLLLLVGGALLQVATGLMNIAGWYAFGFFFPVGHYWGAWVTAGALLVHVGAKLSTARAALAQPLSGEVLPPPDEEARAPALSRRALLASTVAASAAVVVVTAGQTVRPLAPLALLAPRDPRIGPQGLPVNKSAAAAGVEAAATDPAYRLRVDGPVPRELSLADLAALEQVSARLPIACVEGWSAEGIWTGVRVRDVLALAEFPVDRDILVQSLQRNGLYARSVLSPAAARDPLTLLALRLGGEPLHLDHGYPVRLIAPARPGVLQTKWVARLGPR
jgi:DMSO/TMAO reductase YedYZ molybdopterin-dependent catalytic subunit